MSQEQQEQEFTAEELDQFGNAILELARHIERRVSILYRHPELDVTPDLMAHALCLSAGMVLAAFARENSIYAQSLAQALCESLVGPFGLDVQISDPMAGPEIYTGKH